VLSALDLTQFDAAFTVFTYRQQNSQFLFKPNEVNGVTVSGQRKPAS